MLWESTLPREYFCGLCQVGISILIVTGRFIRCIWVSCESIPYYTIKASANKNAILVFAFWTPQHFTYFGWTFAIKFFISDVFQVIDPRKKFDRESSSEVHKMLGCSNRKYENCFFICRRLNNNRSRAISTVSHPNVPHSRIHMHVFSIYILETVYCMHSKSTF